MQVNDSITILNLDDVSAICTDVYVFSQHICFHSFGFGSLSGPNIFYLLPCRVQELKYALEVFYMLFLCAFDVTILL